MIFSLYKCKDDNEIEGKYYCSNRIYEENSKLKASELNDLCLIISQNDKFIIRFPNFIYLDYNLYKRENEEYFDTYCKNISEKICENGFGISIYHRDLKSLSIYSNKYNEDELSEIIQYAININKPYESMKYLLQNLIIFLDKNKEEKNPIIPKNTTIIIDEGASKISILVLFLVVAIPICFIAFVITTAFNTNYYETLKNQPYQIHDYFMNIKTIIKEIENNKTNIIKTNKCMLCFKKIIPYVQRMSFEMKDLSNLSNENSRNTCLLSPEERIELPIDNMNIRFYCGHVFHNNCLRKIKLDWCILCNDQNKNLISVVNKNSFQNISLNQLYRLLVNFSKIFTEEEINKYIICYGNELEKYKDKILRKNLNEDKIIKEK